ARRTVSRTGTTVDDAGGGAASRIGFGRRRSARASGAEGVVVVVVVVGSSRVATAAMLSLPPVRQHPQICGRHRVDGEVALEAAAGRLPGAAAQGRIVDERQQRLGRAAGVLGGE